MTETPAHDRKPLASLYAALRAGDISRRHFIEGAVALGVATGTAGFLANGAGAQDASPTAGTGSTPVGVAPAEGTEGQARGGGGELRLLQWQAPTQMSPHNSTGDKDVLAAQLVLEPLMHYAADSSLIPWLVTDVPSLENGLLSEDSTTVTFKLLEGVTWSDGTPFTANDVVFTWQWVTNPDNATNNSEIYAPIASIEATDDLTAVVTYKAPTPLWFVPFANTDVGCVYPKHILDGGGQDALDAFKLSPLGTGPYVVESFTVNDQVIYAVNENYREPNKPFFSSVVLKGGGDAASAARAVIQTGDYDFAWYTQIEPEILESMQSDDSPGKFVIYKGVYAERLHLNFSDPNTEVDGQRSEMNTPNPRFGDPAVRQALALAVDRQLIADRLFFGESGEAPGNSVITGNELIVSTSTSWEFNPEKANQVLDDAGWTKDGDTRSKDGVELKLSYVTTINQVRQKIQAIVKSTLEDVGIGVDLLQVDGGTYFDTGEGNDQNTGHMYQDMNMHQFGAGSPLPLNTMLRWYAGPDNENIAQASNGWTKLNAQRYINPDYDVLFEAASATLDPETLRAQLVEMNDLIINDFAVVPLVDAGEKFSQARWLNEGNIGYGPFELLYWNIANWNGDRPS
jgi:peptide/nickel transport system substrate-binding protein